MKFCKAYWAAPILVAYVFTAGCDSGTPKHAKTTPPPQATAPTLTQPQTAKAEPPQAAKPTVETLDPVPGQIAAAEAAYVRGEAEYQAGHLESAKENFDKAVSLLMSGPVDVGSDARLKDEFDKIVDGVHRLEMVALKEGDGFTEQKPEPAPIDEANAVTFPVDPNIKAKAEAELETTHSDLPLVMNDIVASYINFFSTRGRSSLENGWRRAGQYRTMIERILREEGVPQDLIYLAQAESGFHPLALSRVGARGMWQFMHYTAPGYGLERNWWVDDRQNPEKATRAAARYLKDLYAQFGDWYLAMAAYNSGAGSVQRGVQRTGYADFWELYKRNVLPQETKNYVPIILALTIMSKNPEQYGLNQVPQDPPIEVDKVDVDYAVDLRLVAEAIDVPVSQLADLNPSLLRMVTPKDEPFTLKLPAGTGEKFQSAIAAIPRDKRVLWRYHKVQSGDTLTEVARKFHTSVSAIKEVNEMDSDELVADSKLIIPVTGDNSSRATAYSKHPTHYRVRKGDTVLSVADDFGVPPEKVRRWNRLKGNSLRAGRRIVIYKPVGSEPAPKVVASRSKSKSRKHKVAEGETLYSIASRYDTTVKALLELNKLSSSMLHAGDVLLIP